MKNTLIISMEELKKAPVSIKVLYAAMTICAITGLILIMVDFFAVGGNYLTVALAFIVASQIINLFGPCRYVRKLRSEASGTESN